MRRVHLSLFVLLCFLLPGTLDPSARADESSGKALEAALGEYLDGNFLQAARALTPLAEDGNTEAQYILGDMLLHMRGEWKRLRAPPWIETYLAEHPENARSRYSPQEPGIRWLSKAASKGHAGAQYSLGTYGTLDGARVWEAAGFRPEDSWEFIESAARSGVGAAWMSLGNMQMSALLWDQMPLTKDQELPDFVPNNLTKAERAQRAKEALEKALNAGFGQAASMLGLLYEKGFLGADHQEEALRYYKEATKYGTFHLVGKYFETHPTNGRTDHKAAYKWYHLGVQFSQWESKERMQALEPKLSPAARSQAQVEARSYLDGILRDPNSFLSVALEFCSRIEDRGNSRRYCRSSAPSAHDFCNYFYYQSALYPEFHTTNAYYLCRKRSINPFLIP